MIHRQHTLSPYSTHAQLHRLADEPLCYCGCMLAYYSMGQPSPTTSAHPTAWRRHDHH